jgi:hypothetical protein
METASTTYHVCPRCFRAVPAISGECYCSNDGSQLLTACPHCQAAIVSPYARFCTTCGKSLALAKVHQGSQ